MRTPSQGTYAYEWYFVIITAIVKSFLPEKRKIKKNEKISRKSTALASLPRSHRVTEDRGYNGQRAVKDKPSPTPQMLMKKSPGPKGPHTGGQAD
jgi:hypothetical protein